VEVHLIRGGCLVQQFLIHQESYNRKALRTAMNKTFFAGQAEMFGSSREDINDMRIIASWCMNRKNESVIIDAREAGEIKELEQRVVQALAAIREEGVNGVKTAAKT
jgi:hypothetical protein